MKVRKKRKEAEREEGEASAIMVSQSVCSSCTLPARRCFLGQRVASARQQGFALVDIFFLQDGERKRQQRGFVVRPFCSVKDSVLCLLNTEELDRSHRPLLSSPPGILFFFTPPYSLLPSHHPTFSCAGHRPDSGRNCGIRCLQ